MITPINNISSQPFQGLKSIKPQKIARKVINIEANEIKGLSKQPVRFSSENTDPFWLGLCSVPIFSSQGEGEAISVGTVLGASLGISSGIAML